MEKNESTVSTQNCFSSKYFFRLSIACHHKPFYLSCTSLFLTRQRVLGNVNLWGPHQAGYIFPTSTTRPWCSDTCTSTYISIRSAAAPRWPATSLGRVTCEATWPTLALLFIVSVICWLVTMLGSVACEAIWPTLDQHGRFCSLYPWNVGWWQC